MKYYSPPLHTQHHTMKHFPPQHATNSQNSPIFTMQGRTFFHNTHHTPTPGRHFFQTTGPSPHQTQAAHDPTTTGAQHCEPTGTNRTPEKNCLRHHHDSGAPPRNLARNSIGRGFNKVRKRCNSNDLNSMFERVAGELRAKLLSGSGAWPGNETRQRANHQHARPHWCGGRRRDRRARAGFEARRRTK